MRWTPSLLGERSPAWEEPDRRQDTPALKEVTWQDELRAIAI